MMWQTFREVLAEEMKVPLDKGFNVKKDGATKHYTSIEELISERGAK